MFTRIGTHLLIKMKLNIVQELLARVIMFLNTSPYSSLVVTVLKKEGTWCMHLDFHALNIITIKDKFPILVIDDILYELKVIILYQT